MESEVKPPWLKVKVKTKNQGESSVESLTDLELGSGNQEERLSQ